MLVFMLRIAFIAIVCYPCTPSQFAYCIQKRILSLGVCCSSQLLLMTALFIIRHNVQSSSSHPRISTMQNDSNMSFLLASGLDPEGEWSWNGQRMTPGVDPAKLVGTIGMERLRPAGLPAFQTASSNQRPSWYNTTNFMQQSQPGGSRGPSKRLNGMPILANVLDDGLHTCDVCKNNIFGDRFKCLDCADFVKYRPGDHFRKMGRLRP
ncbi:hypothetical protein T439DRAFT_1956 [Meredithblackwellia eburnea MCA 4105]